MSDDAIVRCAIWENDLARLRRPRSSCGGYRLFDVLADGLATQLATAMAVEEREVLGRLERGCRAFAWGWHEEIASWLWVSTGEEWAPPLRRMLRFAEGDCYGWNAGTLEHHRGRGLFAALLEYAGWRMAQQGCRAMWNGIIDGNLPSQRAHAAAGYRPVLRLTAVHEPPPTRLRVRAADYADERLVERALSMLGDDVVRVEDPGSLTHSDGKAVAAGPAAGRRR